MKDLFLPYLVMVLLFFLLWITLFILPTGSATLPVVAFPFEDFYVDSNHIAHTLGRREQTLIFYLGLVIAALGSGGIRAIVCPLAAYSLQDRQQKDLMSFFNWFNWLVNLNSLVVFVGISYIQQSVAKNLGFLIPFMSVVMSLITIHMVRNDLIFQPRKDVSLRVIFGVLLNALRMCCINNRHLGGRVTTWLDRAKENNGGWFSELHVENTKAVSRLFPFFAFQIVYRIGTTQTSSGYFIQSMNSNLSLSGILLPIAAMQVISILPLLIAAPCWAYVSTYLCKGSHTVSPPTAIVSGHICAVLSLLVAGIYESYRKSFPLVEQTLAGKVLPVSVMPCFQLAPQYALLGLAEAVVTPFCSFMIFRLTPSRIRSTSTHILTLFNAVACFLGALLVEIVFLLSQGNWYPEFLAEGHLERFFFFLSSVLLINTIGFCRALKRTRHIYTNKRLDLEFCGYNMGDMEKDPLFKGSVLEEKLLQHEKSLMFYESTICCSPPRSPMETAV
ncbi:solute carrier family 15 member 5 [Bombina bombina]|uniref:solute carrier family 15 member 5 n=1 Tax=Bombina bombina TaxID=8345 RepID=UPI00235AFDAF|nr:solute carrier family 15 member 5 [Bombina bombina]